MNNGASSGKRKWVRVLGPGFSLQRLGLGWVLRLPVRNYPEGNLLTG